MRWMLLVDTCGAEGGVAVADLLAPPGEDRLVAERMLPGRETQERLMLALAEVLQQAGLTASQVDVIAVVTGPGSFTGVRIGLAAVKGLAEATGTPMVALSRLAVLASQAHVEPRTVVQAWLDAGRGDVFVGRYRDGVPLGETMLHGADALAGLSPEESVVVMEERLAEVATAARRVDPVSVREALPLAAEKAALADFADIALLDANYLRVPDAELARRSAAHAAQPA